MAVAVEHDKRRKKILDKALAVFVEDGFEDATFQKIADRSGITRTILYLYFKNKREIFTYSIKQLLLNIEDDIIAIRNEKSLSCTEKLTNILLILFKHAEKNRQLLSVVLDYLLHIAKSDINPEERVRRRTVRLRRILSSILLEGVRTGEFKKVKVRPAYDYLYSFIETAIFQLVVLKRKNLDEHREAAVFAVKQLQALK